MYRESYDKETQQISLKRKGFCAKITAARSEGGLFLTIGKKFKEDRINLRKKLDARLAKRTRYKVVNKTAIIPKRIVFSTFQNTYTCNGRYIIEEILRRGLDWELVFIVDKKNYDSKDEYGFPPQVKVVRRNTLESFIALGSAQVWVDNAINCIWKDIPKKKEQLYLNTWHGSLGIKRLDGNDLWRSVAEKSNKCIDYFITDSVFEEHVFSDSFWPDVKSLHYGHPRNDMFFSEQKLAELRKKIYEYYDIDSECKTVLYAPTFRENKADASAIQIDAGALKAAMEAKFGGRWVVIERLHFHNAKNKNTRNTFAQTDFSVDASMYPDMQELMAAADVGITDYSSWIFDFMLSRKPAFIYAEDIQNYVNSRGFYYPLSDTPFAIADSNEALAANIAAFDNDEYQKSVELFLKEKGCYEDGHASERVVDFIADFLNKSGSEK